MTSTVATPEMISVSWSELNSMRGVGSARRCWTTARIVGPGGTLAPVGRSGQPLNLPFRKHGSGHASQETPPEGVRDACYTVVGARRVISRCRDAERSHARRLGCDIHPAR